VNSVDMGHGFTDHVEDHCLRFELQVAAEIAEVARLAEERFVALAGRLESLGAAGPQSRGRVASHVEESRHERLEALESRLAAVEAQLAADGDYTAGLESELNEADRRIAALEEDADRIDSTVDSLLARFGDCSVADIVKAVQAASSERKSIEDIILKRLAVLEAPPEPDLEVHNRMAILEAQQRAAERATLELRRAMEELVVADALFPHKRSAPCPSGGHVTPAEEVAPVHMEHEAAPSTPVSAPAVPAHAVGFLTRAELCGLRAVSIRHAFLPGLGPPAPQTAQQPRVRRERPIGFGSGPAAASSPPSRRRRPRAVSLGGRPRVVARRGPNLPE